MTHKWVPAPTPESQHFWDACSRGELSIQFCEQCARHYFYPRPSCPRCGSSAVRWERVSGRARLVSYVISHVAAPGFEEDVPYAVAVVELEEGPRMTTNIVGVENTPENLVLDMPLQVAFEPRGDMSVAVFTPATEAGR